MLSIRTMSDEKTRRLIVLPCCTAANSDTFAVIFDILNAQTAAAETIRNRRESNISKCFLSSIHRPPTRAHETFNKERIITHKLAPIGFSNLCGYADMCAREMQ